MKFSKKHLIIVVFVVIVAIASFASVFPDPWHEKEHVTFFEWVYREVHELMYGEKEVA